MPKIQRYFADSSGHVFVPMFSKYIVTVSFYMTLILGGLIVVTWPWQGFVAYLEDQRIPYTFPVIFIALLMIQTYIHLQLGRGEVGANYHFLREKMHQQYLPTEVLTPFVQYGFIRFCIQIVVLLFPPLPILLLATAVSGFPLSTLLKALSVIATAALVCRLMGFLLYELWGTNSILGYFLARIFLATVMYLSGFLKVPINPIRVLYRMDVEGSISQSIFQHPYMLYLMTAIGWILLLTILCEWRGRYHRRKEMTI